MKILRKVFPVVALCLCGLNAAAQGKIVYPDISYAGTPKTLVLGGINVSGIEGYEDYMLAGISGLSVGQEIMVPGNEITDAVKRYWRHGLFSDVKISADSIVGDKIYLHVSLALRPRVSVINYVGLKKSEREDMENKLGLLKGAQITPNMIDRAKILAKRYFDDKGFKNADIEIRQRDDVSNKNQVILDVIIDKKEKMKVRDIIIEGNAQLSSRKIKGAFCARAHSPRPTRPASFRACSRPRSLPPNAGLPTKRNLSRSITSWAFEMLPSWKTPFGTPTRNM